MRTRLLSVLALFLPVVVLGQLDLRPKERTQILDGVPIHGIAFSDAGKEVLYEPPFEWRLSGGGSTLTLRPPRIAQAAATISVASNHVGSDFGMESLKLLKEAALGRLPREAQKAEVLGEEKNPLMMNLHETWQVQCAYSFYGQRFKRSALVCNFAKYQLWFELDALESDFSNLHKAFIESLYSLQGLE
jgi:hypothetical protein